MHSRCFIILLLVPALTSAMQNASTLVESSHARALAVLERAIVATGGLEALRGIESVRLQLEGEFSPRLQMRTASPPFEAGSRRESLLLDLANRRLRLDLKQRVAGFEEHTTVVLRAGEGASYDHRDRTVTPIAAGPTSQQQFVQYYRRLPVLLLLQAHDQANTLRHLGEDRLSGRPHDVITFVMGDGQQVAIYVDRSTALISKYEFVIVDAVAGADSTEVFYGSYVPMGRLQMPTTLSNRTAGSVTTQYRLHVEVNPAIDESAFAVAAPDYRRIEPLQRSERIEKLADGVFVLHNIAGRDVNTLAVGFVDYVLVVEAPASSAGTERVIHKIKELMPERPIRYVALTHHHGDHMGGLRSFIAEGATVITTDRNRALIREMAAGKHSDRLARSPRELQIQGLAHGRRTFQDHTQTLELIDIGPNSHTAEMIIAYLPKHRIVFQGDLFSAPALLPSAPQAPTLDFARKLKELNLAVDTIASVHGATSSATDFWNAVRDAQ